MFNTSRLPFTQAAGPPDLHYAQAMEMISLVTKEASSRALAVVVCLRDRHDNLVAHIRMRNAPLGSVDLACQKARSSALFLFPSGAFKQFPGIELSNGIISNLKGGLPLITSEGQSAGSIGKYKFSYPDHLTKT